MTIHRKLIRLTIAASIVAFFGFARLLPISGRPTAPPPAPQDKPRELKSHRVPYRMSETLHLIVRAKLNGKGPYNFIVDTGAPVMFITTTVAREVGAAKDAAGWTTFDRMELEGGTIVPNAKARAEDIFQIRGMNSLGLPGVRLDGVLGYNILSRFRMEIDLSRSVMNWTELEFEPPLPEPLGGGDGKGGGPPELELIGNLMQGFGQLFRRSEGPAPDPRGFIGCQLADRDGAVSITRVLEKSPADAAGLKPGDLVLKYAGASVKSVADVLRGASTIGPNEEIDVTVRRDDAMVDIRLTTGKGF
jgi:hypothetical protein